MDTGGAAVRIKPSMGVSRVAGLIAQHTSKNWPDVVFSFTRFAPVSGRESVLVEWVNGPTRRAVAATVAGLHEDWVPQLSAQGELVFPTVSLSRMYPAKVWLAALFDLFGGTDFDSDPVRRQNQAHQIVRDVRNELDATPDPDMFWEDPPDGLLLLLSAPTRPGTDTRWLWDAITSGIFDLAAGSVQSADR